MNLFEQLQPNPFFPVVRNQLFTDFTFPGEEAPASLYVDRDALLNGENGNVLGTVSPSYKVVTNQEVFDLFSEAFAALPIESTNDHMNWKENRWQRDFILNGDDFNIDIGGSIIKTKVSIFNGYDGKSSVGFVVSAYREQGNVTYLSKMFGQTYSHVRRELVDRIREDFQNKLELFQETAAMFREFEQQTFTGEQFEAFIRSRIREDGTNGYLSERQAVAIIDSYDVQMRRCGVRRTRFGAYTILSAIATEGRGRGNSSPIFTAGYKRMEKLVIDFFEHLPEDLFTI